MKKNSNSQSAVQNDSTGSQFDGLDIGRTYRCGAHKLTIREIEKHFGNWQVCFYDAFNSTARWEHIITFREMLRSQVMPA